jgi:hypothetical protein
MDSLHHVIRAIRKETITRTDHLAVFREFLRHLDRVAANGAKNARRVHADRDAKSKGGKNGKT